MINQKVMRGAALVVIALFFGVQSATYHLGTFAQAGPGLFPLMVATIVGLIGLVMVVQARFEEVELMEFPLKNVTIIVASLVGFILIAKYLTMIPAIVFLVFLSALAGSDYSVSRNIKISIALVAIAFALYYFLGLQLELV
ncbi:MAG: tripartite tricarboxylate transporter TctB family protein [Pseudomonadota bacterium]